MPKDKCPKCTGLKCLNLCFALGLIVTQLSMLFVLNNFQVIDRAMVLCNGPFSVQSGSNRSGLLL